MEEAAARYEPAPDVRSEAARIAGLMGLPRARDMSDMDLVRRIEAGLPLSAVDSIASLTAPGDRQARFAFLSKASYHRLRQAARPRLSRELSERLYGVARVVDQALRLWRGDRAAVERFLKRPHPLLEGRAPLDVARESAAGADLVVRLIGEARAGVAL